jgi:hypothetical protein
VFKLLLILTLIAMFSPADAEPLFHYGPDADGDSVTLTNKPCRLPFENSANMLEAELTNKRGAFVGCWTITPMGVGINWEPAANDLGWRVNPGMFRKAVWS